MDEKMDDFELELKMDFLSESEDLLANAEEAFLRLESERNNDLLLNEIFRLAHNLKGTSKAVGFDQLAELTHVAENLILKLKDKSIPVTNNVVSILLEFKDKVNEIVENLKIDINSRFDIESLKEKITLSIEQKGEQQEKNSEDVHEVNDSIISDAALESLRESGFSEEDIRQMLGDQVEDNPKENKILEFNNIPVFGVEQEVSAQEVKSEKIQQMVLPEIAVTKNPENNKEEESIRVKLSRIDSLNNVIGELVILQTVLMQKRFEFITDDLSNKSIGMMGKLFKELQDISMSLRMLPLKQTFQKMTRIVRDTSKTLGKEVQLHLRGENTEVDKTVLEKIADPLVHIIRNAVDHGLESNEDRQKNGKNPIGQVELMAYHEGSNLVIQITDDGKGINPDVIRKKAIEKGVIKENSNLSDNEIINLIFHPGFSTKEEVSEVSGRGVGMDVVKTNIEMLGGEVKLRSKVEEGSSFKIVLPLTMAIIEGIVIELQGDKFVIPLSQIFEITQIQENAIERFSGVSQLFTLRGEVLPLFNLNMKLGKQLNKNTKNYTVIIVRGLVAPFGVIVDDIINQQQIVIKKLGHDLAKMKGVVGSAIMADGKPSLIIDLFELYRDDLKISNNKKKVA
jgi:two-component system, chemotaxis family, sensor kinase CheA